MMKKTIAIWLLLCISAAASVSAETVIYRDKQGNMVTIPLPVRRAVVVIDYEIIPALGVWDRIAAVSRWAKENDLMRAVRPNIADEFPSVGTGSDINIEALMALRPDFVHTWAYNPETVSFIASKGIPTIGVIYESLQDIYDGMRLLGKIFEKSGRTEEVISRMERIFDIVRSKTASVPVSKRQKALWLYGKPTMVAGGINLNQEIFKLMNAVNPAAGIHQRNPEVSIEQIVQWNPDVIFIWGNSRYGCEDILNNSKWKSIGAVRSKRVFKMPVWSTWSPRLAPEALWMAAKIYPDAFGDVDVMRETDSFYRDVYGISYDKVTPFQN